MATGSNAVFHDSMVLKQLVVGHDEKGAGRVGRNAMFESTSSVKLGGWYNAAKAQMTYSGASGEITGFGSCFNCEMYLPNKTMAGGSYTSLEVNLNMQASTVTHGNVALPSSIAHFKVGGNQAAIDTWEAKGDACVFSFQGLTAANDEVFDTQGGATHTASLRVIVGSTAYWIMLATDPGA